MMSELPRTAKLRILRKHLAILKKPRHEIRDGAFIDKFALRFNLDLSQFTDVELVIAFELNDVHPCRKLTYVKPT